MGLVVALAFHAVMGGACAWRARAWLETRREWAGLPFLVAIAASTLSVPPLMYLFRFRSAWFVHFFADPMARPEFDTLGFVTSVIVMSSMFVATAVGFLAVRWGVMKMHEPWCLAPAALFALVGLLFSAICYDRVFFLAPGRPLWSDLAGIVSLLPVAAAAFAIRKCGHWFREDQRASQPPVDA